MRGAVVLGAVNGAVLGLAAEGYVATYPEQADRLAVASSIGTNPGLAALFGEPRALETIAGFTEWRVLGVLPFVMAIWAVLAVTGALRGEEDAGRWDLLLAGPLTHRRAAAWGLAGLGVSLAALTVVSLLSSLALGARTLGVAGPVWMVAVLVLPAAVFGAVAAVASQVAGSRGEAVRLAAAALGLAYAVRVLATATEATWLTWLTPLGWVDQVAPLTDQRPLPLVIGTAATAALAVLAVALSSRRDCGAGLLGHRPARPSRVRTLVGPTGLAARLARPSAVGWIAGLAALGAMFGLIAPTASEALAGAQIDASVAGVDGISQASSPQERTSAFLGGGFLVVGLLVALAGAGQAAAAREEEASGRLETLLAAPVTRVRWLLGRVAVAALVLTAAGLASGLAAWLGALVAGERLAGGDLVLAGATIVPAGLVVLGIGILALGVRPRWTGAIAYGYVAGAFVLELVGGLFDVAEPLLPLSVFHHVPLVPAQEADPAAAAGLLAVAAAAVAVGAAAFARRDLTDE